MIQWAALALTLAKVFLSFITYLRERDLLQAGEQQMLAKILRGQADDIEMALKAREEVRQRNAAVPPTVGLPDDGYRRD